MTNLWAKAVDQIYLLRTALDIYNGEIKGYSGVPIDKDEREKKLKPKMIQLIEDGVQMMIESSKSASLVQNSGEKPKIEAS